MLNHKKKHARRALAKMKVTFVETDDENEQEPQVRGTGADTERVGDDQPADEPELLASTGDDGAGEGVQPVHPEGISEYLCEVCGKRALLTADAAYQDGWDYPPFIGIWGVVSPRTCGNCGIENTAYWHLLTEGSHDIPERHMKTIERILGERIVVDE